MQIEVKGNDTLWALAAEHLGDPLRWTEIWERNARVIRDAQKCKARRRMQGPDWIFPGTVLEINKVSG